MITIILNHHNKYAEVDMPAMYEELQLALWKLGLDRVPEKYTLQDLEATFHYQSPLEYFVLRLLEGEMTLLDAVSAIYTVIAPPRPIMAQVQILSSGFRSITELRKEIDRMIKSSAQFGSTCFFPVRGWLVGLDGEMEPARDAVMLQNAEVIGEAVQRMQSWIIHDMALCFADTETDAEESLFQKILSARWSVEKRGRKLYGRIDLLLTEDLTPEEQEALEEKTRRITTQDSAASSFALLYMRYNKLLRAPLSYPREHRPFEEKLILPEQFRKAKGSYFDGIQNYSNQFIQFVKREKNSDNLALYNLKTALAALPNMQRFFEHLELEEKLRIMHNELCMIEEHTLMDAYMCCEYYLSHTPNPRFKKYDIKAYFESSKKTEIADVNSSLGALNTVGAVFPKKVYRENIFACYPILLRDFDVTDETMMQAFLLQSIAFADASYDYLVMLIADGEGKIIPNALKFPKRAFQCIQAELYGKDFEYIEL